MIHYEESKTATLAWLIRRKRRKRRKVTLDQAKEAFSAKIDLAII